MQNHIYGLYFPCSIWREKVLLLSPVSHTRECNYPCTFHIESQVWVVGLFWFLLFGCVVFGWLVWLFEGWGRLLVLWLVWVLLICLVWFFFVCGFFCFVLGCFCCFFFFPLLLTYAPKPKINLSLNLGSFSLTGPREVEKSTPRVASKLELRTKPTSPTCHENISLPGCRLGWTQTNILQDAVSSEQKERSVASASLRLCTNSSWQNAGTGFVWTRPGLSGGQAGGGCCSSWFSFSLAMHNCVV